jgi:hypothetical protein
MKKKKRNVYLLITVVAIYTAIIVRFFMLTKDNDSLEFTTTSAGDFKPTQYEIQKDFSITNDYRDPFLGELPKSKKAINRTKLPKQESENSYYPDVQYLGVVSDSKSSAKVLSLKVNGNEYVIREGKTVDSVKVLSGNSNKIMVSYKGKRKAINISGQ